MAHGNISVFENSVVTSDPFDQHSQSNTHQKTCHFLNLILLCVLFYSEENLKVSHLHSINVMFNVNKLCNNYIEEFGVFILLLSLLK